MGSKIFLIEAKGIYVFEEGPAVIRSIACTHIGSGSFAIYDGVPDEGGFFPDEHIRVADPAYQTANGRRIFLFSPQVMGMWSLDGGCNHGLTCVANGGSPRTPVFITVSWIAAGKRPRAKPALVSD